MGSKRALKPIATLLSGMLLSGLANGAPEATTTVTVNRGDTLWHLAYTYRGNAKIAMQILMQSIIERNPGAFKDNDPRKLNVGTTLMMPDLTALIAAQQQPATEVRQPAPSKSQSMTPQPPLVTAQPADNADSGSDEVAVEASAPPPAAPKASKPKVRSRWQELSIDGEWGLNSRTFWQSAAYSGQRSQQFSGYGQVEFYLPWNHDNDGVTFQPFVRVDSADSRRSHADIRELSYFHVGDGWELHAGIDKVFWGVTETEHLVDIVNQTDWIESPDGEDKLGQPMIHLSTLHDWGTLDVFMLPYFRERTFAGQHGRFRLPLVVDTDASRFESSAGRHHVDWATRWSNSFDQWDVAVSGFVGTSREPLFEVGQNHQNQPVLVPFYPQIKQLGLESLYVSGSWIWKLEAIRRQGKLIDNYTASDAGFEYTYYGVGDSAVDVGLLMEYQYDSRGIKASTLGQHDVFFGTRLAFNDVDGSEILAGVSVDLTDHTSRSMMIEAHTRLGNQWSATLNMYLFSADNPQDFTYYIRQDDVVELNLAWHF